MMLHEASEAADAVQDTFVIAAAKLSQLRDPSKLRTWLYAVARNECHHRLRDRKVVPGLDEMPEPADESADVAARAERAELRKLVRDALTGMNTSDREVIELSLRHELEGQELAEALGVSRNHAHAMLSRARNQLKVSLGALLVARTGRQSCETLSAILGNWDGEMTVLLRKQVNRHIENCDVCDGRRRHELAPAALLSVLPVIAALPPGLRERVLKLCADNSPSAVRYRQRVTQRAGSNGPGGFPPATYGAGGMFAGGMFAGGMLAGGRGAMYAAPAAAVVIIGAVIAAVVFAGTGGRPPASTSAAGVAASTPATSPGPLGSAAAVGPGAPTAKAARITTSGSAKGSAPDSAPGSTSGSAPGPGPGSSAAVSSPGARSPSRSAKPSRSPAPSRSAKPSPSPKPSPSSSPSPTPATGVLAVSSGAVTLTRGPQGGPATGTLTLTAEGGPVPHFWTVISVAGLTASPSSGALADGGTVTISLAWVGSESLNTRILINPGDHPVTVLFTPPSRGGDAPVVPGIGVVVATFIWRPRRAA